MPRPTPARLFAALLATIALLAASASPAAARSGPLTDSAWIALGLANGIPNASPLGANDWTCRPSAEHPRPVILLHGTYSNMYASFANMALPLKKGGLCVFAFNYGGIRHGLGLWPSIKGLAAIRTSSAQLAAFVERVRTVTGAPQVDLVGYSQGGLVARSYLKYDGGANAEDPSQNVVHRVVGIASANRGGTALGFAGFIKAMGWVKRAKDVLGPSAVDLTEGSPFLSALNAPSQTMPGVQYTMISTALDQINLPFDRAFLKAGPGATVVNVLVQQGCTSDLSDHFSITFSRRVHDLVLRALDPSITTPARCVTRLPV